ncbi:hypothetical protein KJ966_12875 [bacterium]|nr:hypothetical protein [bacterium]
MKDKAIINPDDFKLAPLEPNVILFFILRHFYMFHEIVKGSKIRSYGPAKRFSFTFQGSDYSALGGFIGAPLAAIILENAIVSGGKHFRAFGTAGWIGKETVELGSLHNPVSAMDKTGMMADYGAEKPLTEFRYSDGKPTCRKIVSVNSFYRLTPDKLEDYRAHQADVIDMEAAPLNHITLLRGGTYQPLFVISDYVDPALKWIEGTGTNSFSTGLEKGLNRILSKK